MKWFDIPAVRELLDEYLELQRKGDKIVGGQSALCDKISQLANEKIPRTTIRGKLEVLEKKFLKEKYANTTEKKKNTGSGHSYRLKKLTKLGSKDQQSPSGETAENSSSSPRKLYVIKKQASFLSQEKPSPTKSPSSAETSNHEEPAISPFKVAHPKAAEIGPKPREGPKRKIVMRVVKKLKVDSLVRADNETEDQEVSASPPKKASRFSFIERCTSPEPVFTVGTKSKATRTRDLLVIVYDGQDKNHWFSPHAVRKADGAQSYMCTGCTKAKYQARTHAKRMGAEQLPEINKGDIKYIWLVGEEFVEERGRHHKDCQPMSNQEVAMIRVKRAEREFLNYVKETAVELEVAPRILKKKLRTFPLRDWPLDGRKKKPRRDWRKIKRERQLAKEKEQDEMLGYKIEDPQEVTLEAVHTRYPYATVYSRMQ